MIAKTSPKKTRKIILIVAIVLFVAACAYLGVALKTQLWPFSTQQTSSSNSDSADDTQPQNNGKEQIIDNQSDTNVDNSLTPDQIPTDTSLVASITQLRQDSSSGDITFSGLVKGSAHNGSCVVTFSNPNDKPVTRQVDGTLKDNTAICGPIIFNELEFSYLGTWSVQFNYYVDGQQANANATINIE